MTAVAAPSPGWRTIVADAARTATAFGLICAAFAWIHRDRFAELFNPWRVQEDARQWVGPLWRHHDPALLKSDYVTGYMRALTPDGYEWLYLPFSGLDPALYGKLLSLALTIVTLGLIHLATVRISRSAAAGAAAVALALVFWGVVRATAGGLPRAFAPVLLAACAWALVAERRWLLAALPVLAGGLYPPMALVLGSVLALRCLRPGHKRLAGLLRWLPDRSHLTVLIAAGALTVIAAAPQMRAVWEYGPRIDSTSQVEREAFPEYVGQHDPSRFGRLASVDVFADFVLRYLQSRFRFLAPSIFPAADSTQPALIQLWVVTLLLGTGISGVMLVSRRARPLGLLLAAAGAGGLAAIAGHPHFYWPSRYLEMPLMVLMVIAIPVIPVVAADRLRRFAPGLRIGAAALNLTIVGLAISAAAAGGHGSPLSSTSVVDRTWRQPYRFLKTLPANALVAGWSDITTHVVLLTGRRVLIGETDLFHRRHILEVRRRVRAVIEASFSPRHEALLDLRNRFGVTHLLVDGAHFFRMPPSHRIEPPYQTWARRRWRALRDSGAPAAVVRCRTDADAAVYDDGRYFILDLRTIPNDACGAGR